MDSRDLKALALLAQLQQLSPTDAETAVRLTLRTAAGDYLGEALLSAKAVDALTDATCSLNAFLETGGGDITPLNEPVLHPELEADLEEYCIGLPVDELMAMAAQDPRQAVAAFDDITAEDGDL